MLLDYTNRGESKMSKRLKVKQDEEYSVKELMENFISEKRAEGRSIQTIESYNNSFKKFFFCFDEEMSTKEIDKGMVLHYMNYLQKPENLHLASINHYLRDLRTFVNWCYIEGYINEKVDIKMVKGQEAIIETYSEEEVKLLIAEPQRNASFVEWRTWAIVNWILATGNRIETIVNIKMGDVHFGRDEIIIREQKNKKSSYIPLASGLKRTLRTYIKKCRTNASDDKYLFCNIEDEQLTTKALQSALYDYNIKRGVDKTSAHALRHTFAKMYVLNGGDIFRLQRILGHSQLEMTRHYVNLFGADLKKGYDDIVPINNLLEPKGKKKQTVRVNRD